MKSISVTGIGAIVVIIESVLRLFGVEVPEGSTLKVANGLLEIVGYVLLVYGQLRRKDLFYGIIRK